MKANDEGSLASQERQRVCTQNVGWTETDEREKDVRDRQRETD